MSGLSDGCIYTWPGYQRPEPAELRLYSYPGDGVDGATSPYLYVVRLRRRDGEGTLRDASLTGPDGPVAVRRRQPHPGRRGLSAAGRDPRPRRAARGRRAYTAQVTFTSDEGDQATRRWSFTTGELERGDRGAGRRGRHAAARTRPPRRCRAAARRGSRSSSRPRRRRRARDDRRPGQRRRPQRARDAAAAGLQVPADAQDRSGSTRSPRRFESRGGRPVRVTVSLPGFFAGRDPVPRADAGAQPLLGFSAGARAPAQARPDRPDALRPGGGRGRPAGAARDFDASRRPWS